jgi:hypothetical protein
VGTETTKATSDIHATGYLRKRGRRTSEGNQPGSQSLCSQLLTGSTATVGADQEHNPIVCTGQGMGVDYMPGAREAAREEAIAAGKNIGTVEKDVRYRGGVSKNPNPNENLFDKLGKVKEVTVGDTSVRDADSARWNAMYGQYQEQRVKDAESQRLRGQAEKWKLDRTREINYAMQYYGKYLQWLQQQAAAAETANTGYGGYGYGRGYGYGGGGGGYYRSGGSAYLSPWYMNMLSWRI